MNAEIIINTSLFSMDDFAAEAREFSNKGIEVTLVKSSNLLPPEIIPVMIEIAKNVGFDAIYDILKFSLTKLVTLVSGKSKGRKPRIDVACNGKKYSISCDFELSEEQRDRLVDAAIQKLMDAE